MDDFSNDLVGSKVSRCQTGQNIVSLLFSTISAFKQLEFMLDYYHDVAQLIVIKCFLPDHVAGLPNQWLKLRKSV